MIRSSQQKIFLCTAFVILLSACANTAEKKVESEVKAQGPVPSPEQGVKMGKERILKSKSLTDEQKIKFFNLFDKTEADLAEIKKQEGPLKASLFNSFAEGRYDPQELSIYFTKVKGLEGQKMDLMFASLVESGKILKKDRNQEVPLEIIQYYQNALSP